MASQLRNIALVGHGGAGKTSLAESLLFKAGMIQRQGRVEDGNTAMDFQSEELKRHVSITSSMFQFPWKSEEINIIDTPGYQSFFSSTHTSIQAADGVAFVIDAVDGVKVRTEQVSTIVSSLNLPSFIFINKLDRERADFYKVFEEAERLLEQKPIMMHLPIGEEDNFIGYVDLVSMKAYKYDEAGNVKLEDIPADMAERAQDARELFVENVAEADDLLIEKYLEGEEITQDELMAALKKGIANLVFAPVLCGCAVKGISVDAFANFINECLPTIFDVAPMVATDIAGEEQVELKPEADDPFSAFVFKTIIDPYAGRLSIFKVLSGTLKENSSLYNSSKDVLEKYTNIFMLQGKNQKQVSEAGPGSIVAVAKLKETTSGDTFSVESRKVLIDCQKPISPVITFALQAKSKKDEDKLFSSLSKVIEEDQSLVLSRNAETSEILLSGLGQVHIEANMGILKDQYNVEVTIEPPKIPYRETIKKKIRVQGKHKKQSGGHGQFGDCWIVMEPLPRGEGFQFVDAIVGGKIPKTYIPAVEQGIKEAASRGIIAGFPCVDFKVSLDDGSYHAVDSSEMSFKMAGSLAFKKASIDAGAVLLEPVVKIDVFVTDEYMGDIMGDLNSRRGRVLGMDKEGKYQVISAHVPMAEVMAYAPDLTSMTGGRGNFKTAFSHYDEVPKDMAEKIITAINAEN